MKQPFFFQLKNIKLPVYGGNMIEFPCTRDEPHASILRPLQFSAERGEGAAGRAVQAAGVRTRGSERHALILITVISSVGSLTAGLGPTNDKLAHSRLLMSHQWGGGAAYQE